MTGLLFHQPASYLLPLPKCLLVWVDALDLKAVMKWRSVLFWLFALGTVLKV